MSVSTKAKLDLAIAEHLRDVGPEGASLRSWGLTMAVETAEDMTDSARTIYIAEEG